MRRSITLIFLAVVIFFTTSAQARYKEDTAFFRGEITHKIKSDTLILRYHLTPDNFDADSVILELHGDNGNIRLAVDDYRDSIGSVIIYDRRENIPFENEWRQISEKDGKIYYDGTVAIPLEGRSTNSWYLSVSGYYSGVDDSVQEIGLGKHLSDFYFTVGMELWSISSGYFKSNYQAPFDKEGVFLGYGLEATWNYWHYRYSISTSWSGLGENFAFSEPFRLGHRRYFGDRSKLTTSIYGAVKLSKLKLKKDEDELYQLEWGIETGIALESPFERIGYHYSSALGGYHTFEVFLAILSGDNARIGTQYLLQRKDNLWMLRVAFHFEGIDILAGGPSVGRENNRPLIHKGLALAGAIPTLIIAAPFYLFEKIKEKII